MIVHHCSNMLFDTVNLDNRIWNLTTHPASGLGMFFDLNFCNYLKGFGKYLYKIELNDTLISKTIEIDDFRKFYNTEGDWLLFQKRGKKLAEEYDVMFIKESNGDINQGIILNDKVVIALTVQEISIN